VLSHADLSGEAFRRLNPKGAVPTLVLDVGAVVTESLAILQYVAACAPEARLGATAGDALEQARINEFLGELTSELYKAWAPVFVPERFVTLKTCEDDARAAAFSQFDSHYARLEQMMTGREWALFGRRTVVDAYLYVLCAWKDNSHNKLSHYAALTAYRARLDGDAPVRRALAEEAAP
jgi:glutathione S-transferase